MTASMPRDSSQFDSRPRADRKPTPCDTRPNLPAPWNWSFDAVRGLQAAAVHAGWIRPSLLGSRDFERALAASERWLLGPWARRV